ncbi:MAG TPA: hypothetical protein VF221_20330 [Chloroflexota bacterium]
MARRERGVPVDGLYGGIGIDPDDAERAMSELGERLTVEFSERQRLRDQLAAPMRAYRGPLLKVVSEDEQAAGAVSELRRLQTAARKARVSRPRIRKVEGGIFSGSIGATVPPPYNYRWTWSAVSGTPDDNSESADNTAGTMAYDLWADFNNSSSVSGRAAVGIYFYPPMQSGSLQIWSTPAFNDDWGTWCTLDSAHADGWIGLYVGSYDLTGAPTGAVVDQQITLWSDDSWWSGAGEHKGSNSGYALHAGPIQVDQNHQYMIWVWCGGDVSAAGWGTFSGSGAGEDMNVSIPSITWELRC